MQPPKSMLAALLGAATAAFPAAAAPTLPGTFNTPGLVVTGVAGSVGRLPPSIRAGALVVTGIGGPVAELPAAINTPALTSTGTAQ